MVPAAGVITRLGRELNYSRSHVALFLRRNAKRLRARKVNRRWELPRHKIRVLRSLIRSGSGPRYKQGEKKSENHRRQ